MIVTEFDHKKVLQARHLKLVKKKMDKLEKQIEKQQKTKKSAENTKIALYVLFPIPLIGMIVSFGNFNIISHVNSSRRKAKRKIEEYEEELLKMTDVIQVEPGFVMNFDEDYLNN